MITSLDQHVGRVMAALEDLGLEENTLVLFTSDNGTTHPSGGDPVFGVGGVDAAFFESTAGLRGFKGSVYEGGLRVPLIARWPGHIEAGAVTDQATYFPDLFATLSELIDVEVPAHVDGISILPTLTGMGAQAERNAMLWIFPEYGGQVALRFGDWKLVRQNLMRRNREPGPWELYDIPNDIAEEHDVAEQHPELIEQGIAILRAQMDANQLFPVMVPGVNR